MRTIKIHSVAAVFGLCLAPALAAAADEPAAAAPAAAEPAAAPAEPPAGTPAAEPAGGVPAAAPTPGPAAVPADTGAAEATATTEAPSTLINVDVEGASAYVWRGMNLFGGSDQSKQNFSVFPSLTATFGGLSIGYWGAFQVTGEGDNDPGTLVDAGVGAETDLILKYSGTLAENLSYSAMLTYWIYAAADETAAGTKTPMYLEPGVGVTYTTAADLGLYVGYYRGLQTATESYSFLYINPSVGKTIPLSGDIGLALGLSGGYKVFTNDPATDQDKALDLTLNAGVTLPFSDMYITPQVHASFVTRDIAGDAEFSDQFIAWAGVHVGYNLGI